LLRKSNGGVKGIVKDKAMFIVQLQSRDGPIFNLVKIGRYANLNVPMIKDARLYYRPICDLKYRF